MRLKIFCLLAFSVFFLSQNTYAENDIKEQESHIAQTESSKCNFSRPIPAGYTFDPVTCEIYPLSVPMTTRDHMLAFIDGSFGAMLQVLSFLMSVISLIIARISKKIIFYRVSVISLILSISIFILRSLIVVTFDPLPIM